MNSFKTGQLVTKSTRLVVLFELKVEHHNKQQTVLKSVFVLIETFENGALIYLAVVMLTTHSTLIVLLNVNILGLSMKAYFHNVNMSLSYILTIEVPIMQYVTETLSFSEICNY